MKEILSDGRIKLIPTDWRYSATIVGLYRYFVSLSLNDAFEINDDEFIYNPDFLYSSPTFKEDFAKFLKQYYGDNEFYHLTVKSMLLSEHPEEKTKEINELLVKNVSMKSIFSSIKYDGTNKDEILKLIEDNDTFLTIERIKNTKYTKYCQKGKLFENTQKSCRLLGFYCDMDKKGKSVGYNFIKPHLIDIIEFDFVMFGFSKAKYGEESIFINSNWDINTLISTNNKIKEDSELKYALIKNIKESSDFLNDNVEVIIKKDNTSKNFESSVYYETFMLSKNSINIFKSIDSLENISFIKIGDNFINLKREIIDSIVNNVYLDGLIDFALKNKYNNLGIRQMIGINQKIYSKGENKMTNEFKGAYKCAMEITENLNENKVKSFKEKLISAISVDDKDNVYKILSKLSNYSDVSIGFIYDLLADYDENKNTLYVFVNALGNKTKSSKEDNENE